MSRQPPRSTRTGTLFPYTTLFRSSFTNDNTVCTTVQGLVLDDLSSPNATARALAGALIGLSCQGNSTAELNGVSINDKRSEDEFTGTAILSYKPLADLRTEERRVGKEWVSTCSSRGCNVPSQK